MERGVQGAAGGCEWRVGGRRVGGHRYRDWPHRRPAHLVVLVGGDRDEVGLGEHVGAERAVGQLQDVVGSHDVEARLVLVHGVQDGLQGGEGQPTVPGLTFLRPVPPDFLFSGDWTSFHFSVSLTVLHFLPHPQTFPPFPVFSAPYLLILIFLLSPPLDFISFSFQ